MTSVPSSVVHELIDQPQQRSYTRRNHTHKSYIMRWNNALVLLSISVSLMCMVSRVDARIGIANNNDWQSGENVPNSNMLRVLSDEDDNDIETADEKKPAEGNVKEWGDDDDDDDDDDSVSVAEKEKSPVASSDTNQVGDKESSEQNNVSVEEEKKSGKSELSKDDDDDDDDNDSIQKVSASQKNNVTSGDNTKYSADNTPSAAEDSAQEMSVAEEKKDELSANSEDTPPNNGADLENDEDLGATVKDMNEDIEGIAQGSGKENVEKTPAAAASETKDAKSEWPEDDDDNVKKPSDQNHEDVLANNEIDESNTVEKEEADESNNGDSVDNVLGNDLILNGGEDGPPFQYHRTNVSEQGDAVEEESTNVAAGGVGAGEENEPIGENPPEVGGQEKPAGNDMGAEQAPASEIEMPQAMPVNDMAGGEGANPVPNAEENGMPMEGNNPPPTGENNVPTEGNPNEQMIPGAQGNAQQPPMENIDNMNGKSNMTWDEDYDGEDDFFEMVKSTLNILFLAAFLTSMLVLRKRVLDRVERDSITVPVALKDELGDVIYKLVTWVVNKMRGGSIESVDIAGATSASHTGGSRSRGSGYGPETIPLSTATDEEWGWDDDETGTNLELSGVGGGAGDQAKEDDDLAMAIAMSLSESEDGGSVAKEVTSKKVTSPPVVPRNKFTPAPMTRQLPPTKKNSSLSGGSSDSISSTSKPSMTTETPSDSIEDLLGQMGGSGGPVITSFGQRPTPVSKPKPPPKKQSNDDDLFASMGLSSFPKKAASTAPPRPAAPLSSGWQGTSAKPATISSAPKSAPSPSLTADSWDDDVADDGSWGDDGDLDDLLDD